MNNEVRHLLAQFPEPARVMGVVLRPGALVQYNAAGAAEWGNSDSGDVPPLPTVMILLNRFSARVISETIVNCRIAAFLPDGCTVVVGYASVANLEPWTPPDEELVDETAADVPYV